MLSKKELFSIFEYLNERLKENSLHLNLLVYGGAAMSLLYDKRPATRDIDAIFDSKNEKLLLNIFHDIEEIFDLNPDWINQDIREPLLHIKNEDLILFSSCGCLTVALPSEKQLLAMKILAARAEPSLDFIDSALLCKTLGIEKKLEVIDIFTEFFPKELLRERQLQFIKYLGKDLGYEWE